MLNCQLANMKKPLLKKNLSQKTLQLNIKNYQAMYKINFKPKKLYIANLKSKNNLKNKTSLMSCQASLKSLSQFLRVDYFYL